MQRIEIEEHRPKPATASMPTTAEVIQRAAAMLAPILPPEFYGRITFFYEHGRPKRYVEERSIQL
jgi:hypothetical protein